MSATKKIGKFEVAIDPLWDPEMSRWYCYIGMREKGTIEPHFSAYGKSPEVAAARAEIMARVWTALRPEGLKNLDAIDALVDDILTRPENL